MYSWFMAELLVILHFAFILFVAFGGLLLIRWRWLALVHLPAVVWGVVVEAMGWICPLTPLENHYRLQAGLQGYDGDFIARYLLPIVYPAGLDRALQLALAGFVVMLNIMVYLMVFRQKR